MMKSANLNFILMFVGIIGLISQGCGPNNSEIAKQKKQDSILRADSLKQLAINHNKITVQGTLLDYKGDPINSDVNIFVCKVTGDRFSFDLDGKGTVTNPSSKIDNNGKFKITFDRSFFGDSLVFTLVYKFKALKDKRSNSMITLTIDKNVATIDLDKIFGTISIEQ